MGKITLSAIKSEITKSGSSKGKFMFFKEGTKARIRFLIDFEDGLEVKFHNSYEHGINVPCQEQFGRECPYCDDKSIKTRKLYVWSVYDYESKEVKLLMFAANNCSPVPSLATLYEAKGTLLDRDYTIIQSGSATNKSFTVLPEEKLKFRIKVKPMSDSAIMKTIDKAYPSDNNEDFEEEDEVPKKKKTNAKPKSKKEPEPEEDEWEEEEEVADYESMKPQELYKLCKERDITCEQRKSKEYYIDLLEEADEENETDEWDEEEDEWEE